MAIVVGQLEKTASNRSGIITKAALAVEFMPDLKLLLNAIVDIDIANTDTTDSAYQAIITIISNDVSVAFRNRFYGALNRNQNVSLLGLSPVQLLAILPNQKRIVLTYLEIFLNRYITLALFGTIED